MLFVGLYVKQGSQVVLWWILPSLKHAFFTIPFLCQRICTYIYDNIDPWLGTSPKTYPTIVGENS
jgi:hypothetical protein